MRCFPNPTISFGVIAPPTCRLCHNRRGTLSICNKMLCPTCCNRIRSVECLQSQGVLNSSLIVCLKDSHGTQIKIYKHFIVISQSLFTQQRKHRQDQAPFPCTCVAISVHIVETQSRHWVVHLVVVITMTRKKYSTHFCYTWENTVHFNIVNVKCSNDLASHKMLFFKIR